MLLRDFGPYRIFMNLCRYSVAMVMLLWDSGFYGILAEAPGVARDSRKVKEIE
jgi:hypothetical protein